MELEKHITCELNKRLEELKSTEPSEKVVTDLKVLMEVASKAAASIRSDELTALTLMAQAELDDARKLSQCKAITVEVDAFEAGGSSLDEFWKVWSESMHAVVADEATKKRLAKFMEFLSERMISVVKAVHRTDLNAVPEGTKLEDVKLMMRSLRSLMEVFSLSWTNRDSTSSRCVQVLLAIKTSVPRAIVLWKNSSFRNFQIA